MKRAILSIGCAAVIAAMAGCGGGDGSNSAANVKVGGLSPGVAIKLGEGSISTDQLARVIEQQKAQAAANNQTIPKENTKEFAAVKKQILEQMFLQRVYSTESKKCGKSCEVSDKEVDAKIAELVKTGFAGDRKKFDKLLVDRKYTLPEARDLLRGEAELLALAFPGLGDDPLQPLPVRHKRQETVAAAALAALRQCQATGFFAKAENRENLATWPQFAPFRARPEFQELIAELERGKR